MKTYLKFINEIFSNKKTDIFNQYLDLGIIKYRSNITKESEDYYEYGEKDNPNWEKTKTWVVIDEIRVIKKNQGNGKKLLNLFINSLPEGTGVLANPVPLDNDISFEELQQWYINKGFSYFDVSGCTLMYVK